MMMMVMSALYLMYNLFEECDLLLDDSAMHFDAGRNAFFLTLVNVLFHQSDTVLTQHAFSTNVLG